jgi:hypothetical protein
MTQSRERLFMVHAIVAAAAFAAILVAARDGRA